MNRIGTIFVPVADVGRAKDWYCGMLGLPKDGEILFGHLYVLPMEGTGIVLDSKIYSPDSVYRVPAFHFNTEDIHEAYRYMQEYGAELPGTVEHDHWFLAKDPDGNLFMVCKC